MLTEVTSIDKAGFKEFILPSELNHFYDLPRHYFRGIVGNNRSRFECTEKNVFSENGNNDLS